MPRNGSGTYSLPEAPFVPQTPISSGAVNSDFSDVASAITASLARDCQGGMTDTLPMANTGAVYNSDPDTGIRRTGANEQALFCGGADIITAGVDGGTVDGDLTVTGDQTVTGAVSVLPVGVMFPYGGSSAPTKYLLCDGNAVNRTTYAALFAVIGTAYGSGDGSTTFNVPDLRGRVPAGRDNMGGVAATRLTSTTMTPDGDTLGAVGGGQSSTLITANLPPYTPAGTNSGGSSNFQYTQSSANWGAGSSNTITNLLNSGGSVVMTTNFTQPTFSGTPAAGQISTPFSNVQPSIITNYIIYAGA